VPVGVFLSGGLDSGCVAALASRHKPGIISVTMTVPEQAQYNEAALARLIAEKHGTTHVEVPLDQGCIRELPALLSASEPLGDSSLIPSAAVAKEAVKYVKVVLTGDGGDESFDGYGKMRLARDAYKARARISGRLLKLLSPVFVYLSQRLITPGLRTLGGYTRGRVLMTSAGLEAFVAARDYSPRDVRKLLYGPQLTPLLGRSYGCFLVEKLKQSHYNEWWEGWMSVGMKTYLPDDLLFKADTATMHHSLESRAPFLDQRVIELAASLPYECLLPGQYTKGLIRRIAARHNPLEAVYAPKKGFSIPVCHYFKAGWGEILLDLTRDGIAAQLGLLQPDGVRKYLDLHRSGKAMLEIPLYSLLVLELWLRVFYSKSIPADELGERLYQATQS